MTPTVSIVIPVYNAENSIRQCLDSVIAQTYDDWECIIVDDGSKDTSRVICDKYIKNDTRFHVYHKDNGGVSSARNSGIEESTGEYLMFIDSDDCLTEDCLTTLFAKRDSMPDLTIFSFNKITSLNDVIVKKLKPSVAYNRKDVLSVALALKENDYTSEAFCFSWNKIFKSSIIKKNSVRFPQDITLREDEIFVYRYLLHCNSLQIITNVLYNYKVAITGLTHRKGTPMEYYALANHIINASTELNCNKKIMQIQYGRALLYMFYAFTIANKKKIKEKIFKEMKALCSILAPIDKKDRKLLKLVKGIMSLNRVMSYYLLKVLGNTWGVCNKNSMNL